MAENLIKEKAIGGYARSKKTGKDCSTSVFTGMAVLRVRRILPDNILLIDSLP